MKTFLLLLLLNTSAIADVFSVHTKLISANRLRSIPLYIRDMEECGLACTNGKRVIISPSLLVFVRNDDEMAGVIGHELAHQFYLGEMQADVLGLKFAQKAGYSYCKAAQFLKRLKGGDGIHPEGAVRYKNTGCK